MIFKKPLGITQCLVFVPSLKSGVVVYEFHVEPESRGERRDEFPADGRREQVPRHISFCGALAFLEGEHLGEGGDGSVGDSARDDMVEVPEVRRHVEREAVHGHPPTRAEADRRNLRAAHPNARSRLRISCGHDSVRRERVNHRPF